MTAGLDRRIVMKVGARIMLRRNIDLTLGLVNGAIGTVRKVIFDIDNCSLIRRLQVQFNHGLVYDLERVSTKFEVLPRVFDHREQFAICLAYAITIYKSQGLGLDNALIDIGSSTFTCGQAYVAFSRLKTLSGVHLINFDPSKIKALHPAPAIVEYNRLRSLYCPHLMALKYTSSHRKKIKDREWTIHPVEYNRLRSLYCPHLMALKYTSSRRKKIKDREWTIHPTIIEAQNDPEEPKPKRKKKITS
ncbi:hypothetical protein M8J77_010340 [Diaphorina citri]|nr:hypothetical protein M8J77_010340 [Diaphorina citri]